MRGLRIVKGFEYEELEDEEFDKYWHIIKHNLSREDTLRLIAEERSKKKESD